jgi:hypothetical protein
MSNLSGSEYNKTFKAGEGSMSPYYYISASLDLANAVDGGTYYFNYDNNYDYASLREYNNYIVVDENVIIDEVVVYANNDLVSSSEDPEDVVDISIGGAAHPSVGGGVQVLWAAPAGDAPGLGALLSHSDVNAGSVHLYGHEGGHHPYDFPNSNIYKFLALQVNPSVGLSEPRVISRADKRRIRAHGRSLPVGPVVLSEGKVTVVLKVFPKFQ